MKPFVAMEQAKQQVARTGHQAANSPWLEWMARFGYAVRGVLYATVGVLALQVALGQGGATTDKNGAIATIGGEPFGKFLLLLIVVGLAGYALWGFVRAFLDPLNRGTDAKGLAQRVGYFVSGLSYGALVIPTLRLAMGTGAGQSNGPADWTAKLLAEPLGKWLVLLLGLVGLVGGLGQMYMAVTKSFQKDFKSWEMSGDEMKWATRVAQFGLVARGLVFAMLGFFVIQAALQANPKEAKGLDGALATLAHQPHGPWVLGLVALGLVAFGVYSMMCARWIRIRAGQGAQPSARRSTHR